MKQKIISGYNSHNQLLSILNGIGCKKFLLVCDSSFKFLSIKNYFDVLPCSYTVFNEFKPNPLYEDVCKGLEIFKKNGCDAVVAVGGGSAIDVAKCIKLYACLNPEVVYMEQEYKDSAIPLIAIPSTAGTGSESTRFAVIYYSGNKQSITHDSIIPDYVILDHSVLGTLPLYQKKCTMLDALCQGMESWWSVNSTEESKGYSAIAVQKIIENKDAYLYENSVNAAEQIMLAANYAGKAINITQTTAPHAMSYKLTSMYKLPHGHAVAICLPKLWKFMERHISKCVDLRGSEYLYSIFAKIATVLGAGSVDDAIDDFEKMLKEMDILSPVYSAGDLEKLASSVNATRLQNNPVPMSENDLLLLYTQILNN